MRLPPPSSASPVQLRGRQEGASRRMVWGDGPSCTLLLLLFSHEVVSDLLWPLRLQQTSFPCLSRSPGVSSNSCPLCQWCHPTVLSSFAPFSSCPQSLLATDLFQWDDFSHQVTKVLELQLQHQSFQWIFRVDFLWHWLVWSPGSPRDSQGSFPVPQFESINYSALSLLYDPLSHPYMTTGKTIALTRWTFVGKVISLLFNMLSRFVIAFLSKSKHPLISWLQSPSPVILESKKVKSVTVSTFSPSICHEVMGPNAVILVWWLLRVSQPFHSPLSLSSRASLVSLRFVP